MMLDFLGHQEAGDRILNAIEQTLASGLKTGDIGGSSTLEEVKNSILQHLHN